MLKESVFSFFITDSSISIAGLTIEKSFGKYRVYKDARTPYSSAIYNDCECAILGIATNVITGKNDDLVKEILINCCSVQDVIKYEEQLGGKYILLYRYKNEYYILGDATCSIPIYYTKKNDFVCSSNYIIIKTIKEYSVDREYEKIRRSGALSQAMPYDITPCREIKQLLPNHFLKLDSAEAKRFVNSEEKQTLCSVKEVVVAIKPMIENLVCYYSNIYKIYCPITAGRDSRVVLASLMNNKKNIKCYTIKHPEHNENDQDIIIPGKICDKQNIPYELIEDVSLTEQQIKDANEMFGDNNYAKRTLRIAHTIKKYYSDGAILNGDIIGQIGKCSLHRDIPELFATPTYFRCKLHNYSREAKLQLRLWLDEVKMSDEKVNTFDLFSVESRMGRWAGQENLVYNSIGQVYLNIFNSRSIVYLLTAVNRNERKMSSIHTELISQWNAELLCYPYKHSSNKLMSVSKANWLNYLLSSYVKYYFDKKKFKEGNLHE